LKRYKLEIIVDEASDEFFDDINAKGETGCDEIVRLFVVALNPYGLADKIKLVEYTDKDS